MSHGPVPQDNADSLSPQVAPTELVTKLVSSTNRVVPNTLSQVVSFRAIAGEDSLAIIMRGGDIASMNLGDPDPQASL